MTQHPFLLLYRARRIEQRAPDRAAAAVTYTSVANGAAVRSFFEPTSAANDHIASYCNVPIPVTLTRMGMPYFPLACIMSLKIDCPFA
jgi:hypothetical protein